MGIDRKAFYALATAMLLGPTGCVVQPAQPANTTPTSNAQPQPAADDNGCISWDPSGECTQWQPTAEGGGPADECVDWDPSGECIQWMESDYGSNMPADECVDWDPSGECIEWAEQVFYGGPADECIEWDPSGECINWMPANEQW